MNEKYDIRELEAKDVAGVVSLVKSSFNENYLLTSIYRCKGINEFIISELENEFSLYKYFVLCVNDNLAAYIEYKVFKKKNMTFLNIVSVSNEFKNHKFGSKIFEYSKAYFQKEGFQSMELDVYATNKIALGWYKKYGFEKLRSNSFYRVNLNKVSQNKSDIYIKNFPQYKVIKRTLGFYFLNVIIECKDVILGVIENDLIIMGEYYQSINPHLSYISKTLLVKNIYYIGNECHFPECKFIDQIERMKLNI